MKVSEVLLYSLKRWGFFFAIVTVSIFLLLIIHREIYAYYMIEPRYQINLQLPLEVMHKPDWCPEPYFQESVKSSMQLTGRVSLFDKDLIKNVLNAYEKNPWVASVESIEKQFPNKLIIKLETRRPVAMVEVKKWNSRSFYYLVDKDSVRLPGEYYTVPIASLPLSLPIIVGVRNAPPQAGEKWLDRGLSDALAVGSVLKKYNVSARMGISTIDVTNVGGRVSQSNSEIMLLNKDKVQIEWGRPIDTDKQFEMSPEEKIRNLYRVLNVSPQLQGVKCVKIQFDQPYIVLLGASQTPSAQKK